MHYTYVLWSAADRKFYIGFTSDLDRRLKEHIRGQCHTTARYKDPQLVFFEAFRAKDDAVRREAYFKTSKGKKSLKLILRDSIGNIDG